MNYVKILIIACEFMAARIVLVLLCTTSAIFELIGAEKWNEASEDAFLTETDYFIKFTSEPEDTIVAANQSAVLNCAVRTNYKDLDYSISWIFANEEHGGPIEKNSRRRYQQDNGSLIFKRVRSKTDWPTKSDVGIYQCKVDTVLGTLVSQAAYLTTAELEVRNFRDRKEVNVGDTARLECGVGSLLPPVITWRFKNQELPSESEKYVVELPGVLYIRDVQVSDAGEYRCSARNPLSKYNVRETVTTLSVPERKVASELKFLSPTPNFTKWVRLHDKLAIECFVGKKDVDVKWMKTSDIRNGNEEFNPAYNTLIIPKVREADRGNYTCVAYKSSSSETISQSFTLEVGIPPEIEQGPKWVKSSVISISKRFECKTRGYPPPAVKWKHNGVEINSSQRFRVMDNHDLIINPLAPQDAGFYQCIARNDFGSASAAALMEFTKTTFPPSVTDLVCTAINSTAIEISFNYLVDRDAASIAVKSQNLPNPSELNFTNNPPDVPEDSSTEGIKQMYVVKFQSADTEYPKESFLTSESSIIDQLQPNTNYTFQVFAYTGTTASSGSQEVSCVTKREGVIKWRPMVVFPDTVYLRWPPDDQIKDYEVRYTPMNGTRNETATRTNSSSMIITALEPGTRYEFTISPILNDTVMKSSYEVVQLNTTRWLNCDDCKKIRWHQISPTSALVTWNFCQAAEWSNCKHRGNSLKGFQIVYNEIDDHTNIRIAEAQYNYPFVIIKNLKPEKEYQISLFVVLKDLKAKVETRNIQMKTNPPEPTLASPDEVRFKNNPSGVLVNWNYAPDISRPLYLIAYRKSISQEVDMAVSEAIRVELKGLTSNTEYEVKIQAIDDEGRCSDFTEVLRFWTPVQAPDKVTNITFRQINSSSVLISWNKQKDWESTNLTFILQYYYSDPANVTTLHIPGNETSILITGLETLEEYSLNIRAKNSAGYSEGSGVQRFYLKPDETKDEYTLDHDQLMGVFIGCGISVFCIAICLIIILLCKRRIEKHYTERGAAVHILPKGQEKHEMRILPKNSATGYKGSYANGCGPNLQLPLLSNGVHSNGYVPGSGIENGRYCNSNGITMHDEIHKLLNADSPLDETCMTIMEMNDRDHEGGDSGYCDRNHSQSPQLKDRAAGRERKCSDITVDDGFYENETQFNGMSPV